MKGPALNCSCCYFLISDSEINKLGAEKRQEAVTEVCVQASPEGPFATYEGKTSLIDEDAPKACAVVKVIV